MTEQQFKQLKVGDVLVPIGSAARRALPACHVVATHHGYVGTVSVVQMGTKFEINPLRCHQFQLLYEQTTIPGI